MFQNLINALKAFFSHPASAVPAAVAKLTQVEQGTGVLAAVVATLPPGNTTTAITNDLNKVSAAIAQTVSVAHTAEAIAGTVAVASTLTPAPVPTPAPVEEPDA